MENEEKAKKVIVVGAGLVGSLFAIFLKEKNFDVEVYERRPDMRKVIIDGGRSINLVVTEKGIHPLKEIGLWKDVEKLTIPVKGRMIHSREGATTYQAYSKDNSECNYSVSRGELNKFLIETAEKKGIKFHFNHNLVEMDLEKSQLTFESENNSSVDVAFTQVFGADGSGSATRKEMIRNTHEELIDGEELAQPLGASYKELFMPAKGDGAYALEKNALHIWPRGNYMLMALPNLDGSFTMTLYLPENGDPSFTHLKSEEDVKKLFEKDFKDSLPIMPDLIKDFFENPEGKLATVRCFPWFYKDKVLLIGDAAHGIVPFFGQGMNAGFDDCSLLNRLMSSESDWGKIFESFNSIQKKNGDAIADMAIENFVEMSEKTGDPSFLLKKEVEAKIGCEFPSEYLSRYSMVVHTTIPYSTAQEAGEIQEQILEELCRDIDSADKVDLKRAKVLIKEKLSPFYKENKISLS